MNKQKPLVIYHGNCADGFGAAWAFWHKYGDTFDYHAGFFNLPPPDITGREVFLVDFSYKRPVVEAMMKSALCVNLIDHHVSAIDDLHGLETAWPTNYFSFTDVNHSGAMLAWKWCFGNSTKPPQLLEIIEDRDLWRFKYPQTEFVQAALFSYPYDFGVWDHLMAMPIDALHHDGEAIVRKQKKDIAEFLKAVTASAMIDNTIVPCANVPYFWCSEVGDILCREQPFSATYYDAPDRRVWSLRSDKNYPHARDVAAIAVKFGGGGHKHASGFSIPLTGDAGLVVPLKG